MNAPRTYRLHIGLFGRRNVGKSSLLNSLTGQQISIVSDSPGTTTDPVEKSMELLPLGPVTFVDTAGLDDVGLLGSQRVARTRQALLRTDLALLLNDGPWTDFEENIRIECASRKTPLLLVRTKTDLPDSPNLPGWPSDLPLHRVSTLTGEGLDDLRQALVANAPEDYINRPAILADLVPPGTCAILVVILDSAAPLGRLILPQVQSIRDLLDHRAIALVVTEKELPAALDSLKKPPSLVVTDSQGFAEVARLTPPSIPLTSFSILFARFQGDLSTFVAGANSIASLTAGDRVLIAEACSHHPGEDDIGTVKIPRLLEKHVGAGLDFNFTRGRDLPADLSSYKLVVHCGACMWNRREMLSRLAQCRAAGVPVTNYGMSIAYTLGIFERALQPFPSIRIAGRAGFAETAASV